MLSQCMATTLSSNSTQGLLTSIAYLKSSGRFEDAVAAAVAAFLLVVLLPTCCILKAAPRGLEHSLSFIVWRSHWGIGHIGNISVITAVTVKGEFIYHFRYWMTRDLLKTMWQLKKDIERVR